jgi:hypothetical protein
VTRESEWDDYTRSRALALLAYESQQCPTCRSFGTLVPVSGPAFPVRWDEYDGKRFEVRKVRCLSCASSAAVQRWWSEQLGDKKPISGEAAPGDGLMFTATPVSNEEV